MPSHAGGVSRLPIGGPGFGGGTRQIYKNPVVFLSGGSDAVEPGLVLPECDSRFFYLPVFAPKSTGFTGRADRWGVVGNPSPPLDIKAPTADNFGLSKLNVSFSPFKEKSSQRMTGSCDPPARSGVSRCDLVRPANWIRFQVGMRDRLREDFSIP